MKLHFKKIGQGKPVIVLHGIFGTGDNWLSLAKEWSNEYSVYLVDLRNHGLSPHHDEFNYSVMAHDIFTFWEEHISEKIVLIGHSMGGKVAMHVACEYPELCEGVVIVDIAPKAYPPHHQHILEGFMEIPLERINNRQEADLLMSKKIPDLQTRQFLLKNLHRDSYGKFSWKLNLKVISEKIGEVGKALPEEYKYKGSVLFIRGSKSNYIVESDNMEIFKHFPKATIQTVHGAGHWVHAEKPEVLNTQIQNFLENGR